jgi:AraC-like DNA-binding protein
LSAEAGYFDQSHFIREFRSVIGAAPHQFFAARDHC